VNARLQEIVQDVARRLSQRKSVALEAEYRHRVRERAEPMDVQAALRRQAKASAATGPLRVIGELKRRSPSAGDIRSDLDPKLAAPQLEAAGCRALSVLTEPDHFGGSLDALVQARAACSLPILRKDFILEPFQVLEAAAVGADAVLLLAGVLDDEGLRRCYDAALDLGLHVLCEAHGEAELERILTLEFPIVGLNARDLRSFDVDLNRIVRWSESVPTDRICVAESGVRSREDAEFVASLKVDAVLVGEGLMRGGDPAQNFHALFGESS